MSEKRVIALGFFDGVHLGHGALLELARKRADELGCKAAVLTFDPHPNTVIFGNQTPLINTLEERKQLVMGLYGMEEMLILPFDREMMELPWDSFVRKVLVEQFCGVHFVCGHDYTFGYQGQGDAKKLQTLCNTLHLGCDVVEKVELLGSEVSSTRIRKLLEQGDLGTANLLLGHRHFFTGTVTCGKKLGRTLGFPTANLLLSEDVLLPACGVYAAAVTLFDGTSYKAVTNVGQRPTVDDGEHITVESWLLDYAGDLYGQTVQVELWSYLRPEQKFESLDELKAAVRKDIETVKKDIP